MSWPTVALGDACDFLRGMTYKPADKLDDDEGEVDSVGVVRTANVQETLETHDLVRVPRKMLKSDEKLIREGDIIISSANSWNLVGKCCQAQQDFPDLTFGGFVTNMRAKAGKADARFIYYLFSSPNVQRTVRSFGRQTTSISNLDLNRTKALEIPLPPLDEQRRIAGILDAADALRRRRREALSLLDALPGTIFAEMFGHRVYGSGRAANTVPLSEVAHIQSGITKGRRLNSADETEETAYLAVANVQDKRLDLSNVKTIAVTKKERERYALAVDDLLLTEGGDPDKLGRGTVWNDEIPGAIHQNHIFRVRVTDGKVQPVFLSHLLSSPYGRGYFLRMAKQTTGIASINKTQLSGFPVILPDEGEQIEFVHRLSSYQDQKERYISHLGEVDGLFASLQSRAFAGEL